MKYTMLFVIFAFMFSNLLAEETAKTPDSRLNKKITYSTAPVMLQQAAEELSKATEVTIEAGFTERDWKSRERMVAIRLLDIELGTGLNAISDTLHFYMGRFGDGDASKYTIWADLKSRQYEEAMLRQQKEEGEQAIKNLRQKILDEALSDKEYTADELTNLKDKDPWLAYLHGTESGKAFMNIVRGLNDVQKELMLRGNKVSIPLSDLSPEMQASAQTMIDKGFMNKMSSMGGDNGGFLKGFVPDRIVLEPLDDQQNGKMAGGLGMAGMMFIQGKRQPTEGEQQPNGMRGMDGMPMAMMPLMGSNSPMASVIGKMFTRIENGEDPQTVFQSSQSEFMQVMTDTEKTKIVPTPTPTDPELLVEIPPIEKYNFDGIIDQFIDHISKNAKVSIIMEYYPGKDDALVAFLPQTKTPLYKLLDRLQLLDWEWEYKNKVIRIRPKDWAIQRSYDVPESTMNTYAEIMKTKGFFDLDDLGNLAASLTKEQITNRFATDKRFEVVSFAFRSGMEDTNRNLLKLYGQLNPIQKNSVKSDKGLTIAELDSNQWKTFSELLEDMEETEQMIDGKITFKVETKKIPNFNLPQAEDTNNKDKKDSQPKEVDNTTVTVTIELVYDNIEPKKITRVLTIMNKEQIESMKKVMNNARENMNPKKGDTKPSDTKETTDKPVN